MAGTNRCDHRKAASGFAGARGLDGGVERELVGLLGNARDQRDDIPMRWATSASA